MLTPTRPYYCSRQFQLREEQAFESFRSDLNRYSEDWVPHLETARLASTEGDSTPLRKRSEASIRIGVSVRSSQARGALEALGIKIGY